MAGQLTTQEPRPLVGRTILVLEDEALIALEISLALGAAGAQALCAKTVAAALTLIDRHPLSAAIVDFRLDTDGADPAIKALEDRNVPYMFYTGYRTEVTMRAPLVGKPGSMDKIINILRALIGGGTDRHHAEGKTDLAT